MKTRNLIFLSLAILMIAFLAFLLRSAVRSWIILPLAKFFWMVEGYYAAFPQAAYWILALGIAILVALLSLRIPDWGTSLHHERWKQTPGSVREMSFWIERTKGGIYPKWHVAHLLADLALDIIDRRGSHQKHERLVASPDWNPPDEVRTYLDAAQVTSYTDYPRTKRFSPPSPTPFDQDLEPVIEYLESLLESEHDDHS
jgi:hypothetical protein